MADAARQVLTFGVGDRRLAIDAGEVAEVMAAPRLTRVPQAPAALAGLANVRGKVAPIVSVAALLGDTQEGSGGGRVIILDRDDPVGLAVDDVSTIRAFEADGDQAAEPVRLLELGPLLATAFASLARASGSRRSAAASPQERAEAVSDDLSFLAFELAGQAYALALEQVREAVPLGGAVIDVPGSDPAMLGVMPHRGGLLPIVSLKALLGLPGGQTAGPTAVVASIGETALGLAVDRVRGILRVPPPDVGATPSVLNRGAGEARIAAIARTRGGLVSILAAERIFREDTVRRILAESATSGAEATATETGETAMEQFVLFRLADETYGLPIAAVDEVLTLPERWTRVPRAPGFVLGVMNHRGAVLPLIDQRRRFQVAGDAPAARRRVVIARLGDVAVGFVVDAVERILGVPAAALTPAPDLVSHDVSVFDRIASVELDGRLVLLVDPRQLLDQAERDLVAALVAGESAGDSQVS